MTAAAGDPTGRRPAWLRMVPLLVVLAVVVVGLVLLSVDRWRRGTVCLGAAAALAGLLRLVLPEDLAGFLVVRTKTFDVMFAALLTLGAAALVVEP